MSNLKSQLSVPLLIGFCQAYLCAWPASASYTLTTLTAFDVAHGVGPAHGVALDAQGNLYGTTTDGGAGGGGTVFRIDAGINALTTLASFDGTNGFRPFASPTLDARGNLYGTTGGLSGNKGT